MTKHNWSYCIIGLLLLWGNTCIVRAQNNPYVDDKLFHYGFSLGVAYLSYGVTEADSLVQMDKHGTVYHARTSTPGFLVTAGFIADLRLSLEFALLSKLWFWNAIHYLYELFHSRRRDKRTTLLE